MSLYGLSFVEESADTLVPVSNKYIEDQFGYTDNKNSYNALIKVSGIDGLLRGRSEMLVLNEDNTELFVEFRKDGSYKIPGGSWNENEDHLAAAVRETNEEMKVNVKDILYAGAYISYYSNINGQRNIPKEYRWIGTYTKLYISTINGFYNKPIDKKDQDDIYWKGKFYNIKDIYSRLNKYHKHAIYLYKSKEMENYNGYNC